MQKRPTNKDVAKMAGVSVATVSYVINGVKDKHVSEATRKKVLHAINFLNYSPNPHAVRLSNNSILNTVAVRTSPKTNFLQEIEMLFFLKYLNNAISQTNHSFKLSYLPDKSAVQINADACICIDFSREDFYALSNENFIPIIAVDCLLNDPVFYQVVFDYSKMKEAADTYFKAPYTYVCPDSANSELKNYISEIFDNVIFCSDISDILADKPRTKNILLTQCSLCSFFNKMPEYNTYNYCQDDILERRAQSVLSCIEKAINRTNIENPKHFIKV